MNSKCIYKISYDDLGKIVTKKNNMKIVYDD